MKTEVVRQTHTLIDAKYSLNLNEMKLILHAITNIKPEDEEFKTYRIKVLDLESSLNVQLKYDRVKLFCGELLKKPLYIPKENGKGFLVLNWFSSLEYFSGEGEIEYEISPKLKPYLLQLKECFVKYNFTNIISLKSVYSIRIFQLLKAHEGLGKRKIEVSKLFEMLSLSEYPYGAFKRNILKKAQGDLEKHCDIAFDFLEVKNGRRVEEIIFKIKKNTPQLKSRQPKRQGTLFDDEILNQESKSPFLALIGKKFILKDEIVSISSIVQFEDCIKLSFAETGTTLKIESLEMLTKVMKGQGTL